MEHHADFAVPITHWLWIESTVSHDDGRGQTRGWAVSLGWWTDPGHPGPATGTLYLVVDERGGPPVWIAEGNIHSSRVYGGPNVGSGGEIL